MVRPPFAWVAVVAVAGAVACATNRPSNQYETAAAAMAPVVTVRNDNWLDVAVYVIRGAAKFRIGTVSSTSSETFRLTAEGTAGSAPLQIMADPIGASSRYVTDPVTLGPGQRLEVKVGSPLSISTFAVWNR